MSGRVDAFFEFVRRGLVEPLSRLGGLLTSTLRSLTTGLWRFRWRVLIAAVMVLIVYGLCTHPPFDSVRRGEVLARIDSFDGSVSVYTSGTVLVLPGIHQVRRYSIRDQEKQELLAELKPKFTAMGLVLREVDIGKVDLPADYRAGMEKLLSEELETEKVHYTLQLKEAQVKQQQLEAEADKARRQTAAEAAGQEQVIAARAQEETMKHILPFKQKQIEQRQLEAEADKVARIRTAEGAAEARRIEAKGEADSRQKLADAEAYRLDLVGKANAGQMEREGVLVARYPLLIQKALADKLSDKVQVIIAPLPAAGKFIGSSLIGDQSSVNPDDAAATVISKAAAVTSKAGASR